MYTNSYIDENGFEKLECPICHRGGFNRLKSHLVQKHKGIEIPEETKLMTDLAREQQANRTSNLWKNDEFREKNCKALSEATKRQWQDNYEVMKAITSKSLANYRATEKYHNEKSAMMKELNSSGRINHHGNSKVLKELWSDPDWRANKSQRTSELMKKRAEQGLLNPASRYGYFSYKGHQMRSFWEVEVAMQLDESNIKYQYEEFCVHYSDESGKDRLYRPDFYLPELNLILEIHPAALIDERMKCKEKGCIELGYKFLFITNPKNIIEQICHPTTIES